MYAIRSYYGQALSTAVRYAAEPIAAVPPAKRCRDRRITSYNVCYTKLLRNLASLFERVEPDLGDESPFLDDEVRIVPEAGDGLRLGMNVRHAMFGLV